jgi:fatty-acyl-CoA synthase
MISELAPELEGSQPGQLQAKRMPSLQYLIQIAEKHASMFSFKEIIEFGESESDDSLNEIGKNLQFDDPINIQFTSGTTGTPKGATLTHHNILNNGYFIGEKFGLTEKDRMCIPVPLYHCFGMVIGNLACMTHGTAMIYPSESFEASATLETIETQSCTGVLGVPSMFIAMLQNQNFNSFDFSSLRTGMMAGSPCPIEVMKEVTEKMNLREMTIGYGMTETSPVSTQTDLDDSIEHRVASVGRVHPYVEIKIVDESGKIVGSGVSGEFCARGYHVMRGYWGDDEKTSDVIDDSGWMHTGDLATMDRDGYFNIVGRIKDMVIRGGENLFPKEIEDYLFKHPKIAEVQVFGVPDLKYGEELCAWIKLVDGEDSNYEEIREFCHGQIAHYKVPRYIEFVDSFPMTITGKVQKFVMREQTIQNLKLQEAKTA